VVDIHLWKPIWPIVLVSILIGKPFTLQYARKSTPPEQWTSQGWYTSAVCWRGCEPER
jgi:hypothetical protein